MRCQRESRWLSLPIGVVLVFHFFSYGLDATEIDALTKRLTDSSLDVQIAAAQALSRSGHVDTGLPVLVKLLEHPKWAVRLAAANAIDYLGSDARPAIPALCNITAGNDKQDHNLRWVCGHTLRQLGMIDSPMKYSRTVS